MNIQEAKKVIRDDSVGPIGWGMAALTIASAETEVNDARSLFGDLLICLNRGELASSIAVCALYGKTGRTWPEKAFTGVRDPEEWRKYLEEYVFFKEEEPLG